MHIGVVWGSAIVIVLSLVKSIAGQSKSYSIYLFLMGLCTFVLTMFSWYLAYLAFFSPCALKWNEMLNQSAKTFTGWLADRLPAPDQGVFSESNVFTYAEDDKPGVMIFLVDLVTATMYAITFLSSLCLC